MLTCPHCWQAMRIVTVEIADGREQIRLVCDLCKTEATQDQPAS